MGSSLFPNYTLEKKPYLELKYWKIFKGVNKASGENISAFIFEKKLLDKKTEKEKDNILLCLRKEPETLIRGKNKHKNFLTVIESLKEDNYSLGFITEYIDYNLISWINNYHPTKFEIKYIIYQILSVINFIHTEYHISHNNLCPENIFITENNFIKITGFMFNTSLVKDNNSNNSNNLIYSKNVVEAFLDLKYICPELIINNEINSNSDNFIIGLISYYLLGDKNNNQDLFFLNDNSYDSYRNTYKNTNIDKKINSINNNDDSVKDFLKSLLQNNSEKRKNLPQIQNSKFFIESDDNNKLIPLCLLSKMESAELTNNYDLLKLLPNILNLFTINEKQFLVLPNLLYYLKIESLINPIVPSLFLLAEQNNRDINFEEKIWPSYKKLFNMKKFPAATLYFTLKKLQFLINNLEKTEFNNHCIPLICKALDCGVLKIQEVILEELPNILKNLDKNEFENKIYNRLVKIVIQTKNKQLRKKIMSFFICLSDYFDSYFINNNFLDDIEKIIKNETTLNICKNAFILYKKIKLKVNDKSVRSKIIPSLLLMMCNGEISEDLFIQGEKIIHSYIQKIKEKRKDQFVQDVESDSDEKNNNKENNEKKLKKEKNGNSALVSSPLSVTRTKSTLSGNISLFECNSSEDSNFALDEKNKNLKEKNEKNNKNKNIKKIVNNQNNNNNLFDNLLNENNEDIYNKNADSSFDSTSIGKNKKEFNFVHQKEFLSSLELKKIEKKKKLENNNTNSKISNFNDNKKNKWEEIESDDENTDELTKYIKPKKSKEIKNENNVNDSTKKSDKKSKWDEDDEDDDYEDANNDLIINKKNEKETNVTKDNLIKKENNNGNKLDELLLFNNEEEDNKDPKNNDINPINKDYNNEIENILNKDKDKEIDKEKDENNKKKGVKKKKKHKKKDKKEKKEIENEEKINDNEIKNNKTIEKENKEKENKEKENKEEKEEKEKKEVKEDKEKIKENSKKDKNTYERQISTTKMRMNQRAANIDLDNLLADDD